MKLSIIIPCYKVEQYLDQCLESVTRNKTDDIEIILVDDGSPDRIPEMCDEWAKKDARIKVIHQENGGLSVARNSGLDASTGDYVWFIDSDDWITDDAIERVLSLIGNNTEIDDFVFPLKWTYEDSRKDWLDINISEDIFLSGKEYLSKYPTGASPRNIIKRTVLKPANIRFYPGIVHEDALFGLLLFNQSDKIYLSADFIYNYRQREDSIMHTRSMRSAYSYITIHQQMMKYCEAYVPKIEQNTFRRAYIYLLSDALTNTWHIHTTEEFKKYLSDTREYRISECLRCKSGASTKEKVNINLLAYHPVLFVYCHNWSRFLSSTLKQSLKTILVKTGVFDVLYSIMKGKR